MRESVSWHQDNSVLQLIPIGWSIDVLQGDTGVERLRFEAPQKVEELEARLIQGLLNVVETRRTIHCAKRLQRQTSIPGGHAECIGLPSRVQKILQKAGIKLRHVASHNQVEIAAAATQRSLNATKWTAPGPLVSQAVESQLRIPLRRAHDRHTPCRFFDACRYMFDQGMRSPRQQRLVCAHPRASSTNEDEASGSHEKMVASARPHSGYNWTNKVRLSCFIALLVSSAAWGAGLASPEAPATSISVVRVAANGHLVRVVQSRPAHQDLVASKDASIQELVSDAARRFEVDPLLIHSVMHAESNFNPTALSPKGAQGLMQLIPATARRFGAADAMDPKQNIDAGVRYLKYLQHRFPDDLTLAIAAYNAGEGAVTRYRTVPPYRETRGYVQKVSTEYRKGLLAAPPPVAAAKPEIAEAAPAEEPVRHLEQVIDTEGRLYLRTR